jgi:antibiotic biosynthesis monooxygenase (ABM) superfamily enzyme
VLAFQKVRPERWSDFLRIQEQISAMMSRFPGFIGKEVVQPVPGLQDEFVSVFRFSSPESLRGWMESGEREAVLRELDSCGDGPGRLQVVAGDGGGKAAVTVVFSHRVKRGCEAAFVAWREEVVREMAGFPGFLGADFFDARGALQEEWVLIVRFESAASLESWMTSGERAACVARLTPLVEGYSAHPLGSGLGGWFAFDDAPPGAPEPPRWKQILMVTLGLYPTVMLLAVLVEPHLAGLPMPVRMIVVNIVCVSLLSWPVMPWLNRRFSGWLSLRARSAWTAQAAGAAVVLMVLLAWLGAFLAAGAGKN